MLLCFDTETTGLMDFKQPSDAPGQPRLLELGAALFDVQTLEMIGEPLSVLVKPDGWTIEPGAEAVHKISLAMAQETGRPIAEVIEEFDAMCDQATVMVGFNLKFDQKFARSERRRLGRPDRYGELPEVDIMWEARPFAGLVARNGNPKLPKLTEAYQIFCGRSLVGAHSALADVGATMAVAKVLRDNWKIDLSGRFPPKNDAPIDRAEPEKPAPRRAAKPKADEPPMTIDTMEIF